MKLPVLVLLSWRVHLPCVLRGFGGKEQDSLETQTTKAANNLGHEYAKDLENEDCGDWC